MSKEYQLDSVYTCLNVLLWYLDILGDKAMKVRDYNLLFWSLTDYCKSQLDIAEDDEVQVIPTEPT